MTIELTKDSDALICLLYKEYCNRRKSGVSKLEAKQFDGSEEIHRDIAPKLPFDDIEETCRELHRSGLIECFYADNIVQHVWFTDKGIIYMENRFKNGLGEVLSYLERIKGLIPFI